jgi:BirA family biotin operon repressor/biotin-[acetyl-CoA-carboxylase] ligase
VRSIYLWSQEFDWYARGITPHFYQEIDSTNNEAKRLFPLTGQHIFQAHRQLAGRGQFDRTWLNVTQLEGQWLFTWSSLEPKAPRPELTLKIGEILKDSLEHVWPFLKLSIKAPNDLYREGRKCAGILCETVQQGEWHQWVVGIGLNVFSSPESLKQESTFLLASQQLEREQWLQFLAVFIPKLQAQRSHSPN